MKVYLALLICLCWVGVCESQTLDPYRRIIDPRAIARLDGIDNQRLHYRTGHFFPSQVDSTDGSYIFAQDTGAGIITHFWCTAGTVDSLTKLSLYIDGKLILRGTIKSFFNGNHGLMRAPFDSACSGAYVCDVQIPYQKSFRITYTAADNNDYYAIAWRRIADPTVVEPFSLSTTTTLAKLQKAGEGRFHNKENPWAGTPVHAAFDSVLHAQDSIVIFNADGPGLIQTLHFMPSKFDTLLDSVWLEVYWDNSPVPSIHAPLSDFYGAGTGVWPLQALQLKTDTTSGFTSYFPMPFAVNARIMLMNRSTTDRSFTGFTEYSKEAVSRTSYGYFHAYFSETNPTRYGVYHPVLHTRGRGRLIGMQFAIPHDPFPVALEGDPLLIVDSTQEYSFRYTGGEDYFNGAWWFIDGPFSLPFAGFTHRTDAFYRFHYLDAVDYTTSFDFLLQHGVNNDVKDHYKTVAYYYQHWTPFWIDRDTIRTNETCKLGGSGYQPNETITATLDSLAFFTTKANAKGVFNIVASIPASIVAKKYTLRINGEERPDPVYVIDQPAIRIVKDDLPLTVNPGDTVRISGSGFHPGETVLLSLDSIAVTQLPVVADSAHRIDGKFIVPYVADWGYHVLARASSGSAVAQDTIHVSRTLNYEFEDLLPPSLVFNGKAWSDVVSFFWYAKWSKQSFAYFKPNDSIGIVTFQLDLPRADTFRVDLFATVGHGYGRYYYYIDDAYGGRFDGYKKLDYDPRPSDTLHAGTRFLTAGPHKIKFVSNLKNDSADGYLLGADHIVFTPLSKLALPSGIFISASITQQLEDVGIDVFPNPLYEDRLNINLRLNTKDSELQDASARFMLYDQLGREVRSSTAENVHSGIFTIPVSELSSGAYICRVRLRGAKKEIVLQRNTFIAH